MRPVSHSLGRCNGNSAALLIICYKLIVINVTFVVTVVRCMNSGHFITRRRGHRGLECLNTVYSYYWAVNEMSLVRLQI